MDCKCNWVEAILAIVIIVSATMAGASSKWVIIIAALLMLLHALFCRKCQMCEPSMMESKSMKKKRR